MLFDATLGVLFNLLIMTVLNKLLDLIGKGILKSGNYFRVVTPEEHLHEVEKRQRKDSSINTSLIKPIVKID